MKKILITALCFLVLAACNKDTATSGSTKIIVTQPVVDTFTLANNGVTYTDSAGQLSLACEIDKAPAGSVLSISNAYCSFFPASLQLVDVPGPLNSLGIYKVAPVDSPANQYSTFFEASNGVQQSYSLDSIMVNITYASVDTVKGSYTLWVHGFPASQPITGIIRCYHALVD